MEDELDAKRALEIAQGAAYVGQCRLTRRHARERSVERMATASDIRSAILTAKYAEWRADASTWKLCGGVDIDGDGLDVAVAIEGHEVRIVTLY
jgi:hypothetical protein